MERNETPISKAIKAKLRLVDEEVEAAWLGDRGHIYAELDPSPYFTATLAVDTTHIHHRAWIESFPYITAMLIMNKAKSMIATAREALLNVGADENLQVDIENFILAFFDYSHYTQRLPVFVGEVERKLSSWRKDYNPEELGLTKIEDLFQSYVKYALQKAREVIDVEFTLLRTQTTPKHLEVREETDRPISNGLSKPYVVKKMEMANKENFFRKEGDFWEVSFDGKAVRGIKHLAGMDYIQYLLEHPGQAVPASEFIRTPLTPEEGSRLGKMHEDQLEELGLSKSKSLRQGYKEKRSEEIVEQDQRSKEILINRIKELEETINDRDSLGEEVRKAQQEREDLIKELTAALDKSADKPRKAVFSVITRAINRMKKHHSSLAEHLKKNIHLGYSCFYTPPIDPNWNN